MNLLALAYVVTGLYSIIIFFPLFRAFREHNLSEVYEDNELVSNKYAILLLVAALILTPIEFGRALYNNIPEGLHEISLIVELNDGSTLKGVGTIRFFHEVEYYDSGNDGEPLFGLSDGNETVVYRYFYLVAVDCGDKYLFYDYDQNPIEGNVVKASAVNKLNGMEYESTITLPELNDQTLGITLHDKLKSYSITGYIEHILIMIVAVLDIILCLVAVRT